MAEVAVWPRWPYGRGGWHPDLERLLGRWQVPEPIEGHEVEYWVDGERVQEHYLVANA